MAENTNGGAGGGLYFIVGGLVVIVGLGVFLYFGGYIGGHHRDHGSTTIERTVTPDSRTTTIERH